VRPPVADESFAGNYLDEPRHRTFCRSENDSLLGDEGKCCVDREAGIGVHNGGRSSSAATFAERVPAGGRTLWTPGEPAFSAQLLAQDKLQARPDLGDGANLDVDEPHGKSEFANDVFGDFRRYPRGLLRPGHPDRGG